MHDTLAKIDLFKLKQGKYCSRLYYYCADNWVPQEAIFYLAATNYIFDRDPSMTRIFTDVLWQKQGQMAMNLRFNYLSVLRTMIGNPEIKVNNGTAQPTLARQGGQRFGSAADYNIFTTAIEYCTMHVSQTTIVAAQRALQDGNTLVSEPNHDARKQAKRQINELLGPLLAGDPLKKLGVFH